MLLLQPCTLVLNLQLHWHPQFNGGQQTVDAFILDDPQKKPFKTWVFPKDLTSKLAAAEAMFGWWLPTRRCWLVDLQSVNMYIAYIPYIAGENHRRLLKPHLLNTHIADLTSHHPALVYTRPAWCGLGCLFFSQKELSTTEAREEDALRRKLAEVHAEVRRGFQGDGFPKKKGNFNEMVENSLL